VALIVTKAGATVTLTSSVNPVPAGQPVTLTAKLSGAASGSVQFLDGTTVIGTATAVSGTATAIIQSFTAGTHNLTASYSGDSNYAAAVSAGLALNVTKASVTVTLTSSANPAHAGKPVTLTAKVPTDATGSVKFLDGTTVIGTANVAGGTVTTTVSGFTNGTHNLTASYGGDSNYSAAVSAVLALNVTKSGSSVTLASSANPVKTGQSVTLTAQVAGDATGSVQFLEGTTVIGTASVVGGAATTTVPTFAAGTHSLTAAYGGDSNYFGAVSSSLELNVTRSAATVTLTSSQSPVPAGQPVTLTAAVEPSNATGSVEFLADGKSLGVVALTNGPVSLTVSFSTAGRYDITAAYSGNADVAPAVSDSLGLTVNAGKGKGAKD